MSIGQRFENIGVSSKTQILGVKIDFFDRNFFLTEKERVKAAAIWGYQQILVLNTLLIRVFFVKLSDYLSFAAFAGVFIPRMELCFWP